MKQALSRSMRPSFSKLSKGQRHLCRPPRKPGGVGATRGTGKYQISVMVVRDRREGHTANFKFDKPDARRLRAILPSLIDQKAVLCSHGPAVYAAFPVPPISHTRSCMPRNNGCAMAPSTSTTSMRTTADSKISQTKGPAKGPIIGYASTTITTASASPHTDTHPTPFQ